MFFLISLFSFPPPLFLPYYICPPFYFFPIIFPVSSSPPGHMCSNHHAGNPSTHSPRPSARAAPHWTSTAIRSPCVSSLQSPLGSALLSLSLPRLTFQCWSHVRSCQRSLSPAWGGQLRGVGWSSVALVHTSSVSCQGMIFPVDSWRRGFTLEFLWYG